jgi:hypothetical protein
MPVFATSLLPAVQGIVLCLRYSPQMFWTNTTLVTTNMM